jgi:osmoprotectant transport system substrate-binding protein
MSTPTPLQRRLVALGVAALTVLAACGDDGAADTSTTPLVAQKLTVTYVAGSKQSELISSIYAQALEQNGFRIARKNPVADEAALFQAVTDGVVQLVPTTTADLVDHLHALDPTAEPTDAKGPAQQQTAIEALLPATLRIGAAAPALDNPVIACSKQAVADYKLSSFTSLALSAGDITIGAPEGFETSEPLGLGTWADVYHAEFKNYVPVPADLFGEVVDDITVDCLALDSLDPVIASKGMTILEDDQLLVPTRAVLPLLSADGAGDDVLGVLDAVSAKLTTQALNQLMNQIVTNGLSPDVVAKAFLESIAKSL